jgi:hypothetical protein
MTKKVFLGIFVILNLVLRSQTNIDYLTGTANVNFPIYSLPGRTMDFPVTLNYNSSSPKVNDIASWVGLGWTLNAGGAVTREVHGLPDEVRSISANGYTWCDICGGYLRANDFLVENGFVGPYVAGSTPNYSGGNLPQDVIHTPTETNILTTNIKALISSGKLDLEPDLFQVNAPGLSLKFMFSVDDDKYPALENGFFYKKKIVDGITYDMDSVITFPKQDIIVEYTRTENEITSFIITNLDGTIYKFEQKQYIQGAFRRENDIERDGISYVMAWMLTSITNANGQEEAHFTYVENENYSSHRYLEENRIAFVDGQYSYTDMEPGSSTPVRQGIGFCEVCDPLKRTLAISKMKLVRIESIVTPHGSIVFSKVVHQRQDLPNDFALNHIQLLNSDYEFLGRCELKYDYFITTLDYPGFEEFEYPEDSKRLKLASITFYDSANINIDEGTQFNYNESGLPVRNSYAQDHWGYFNNQDNTSLACEYNFDHPYNRCGPNRESGYNSIFTDGTGKPCLLSMIKYPDGGYQQFQYEPNTFSKIGNQDLPLSYNVSDEFVANVNHMLAASCYEDYTFETDVVNFTITWDQDAYIEFSSNETGNANITCSEPPNNSFLNRWITIENSNGVIAYQRLLSCSDDEYSGRELVHLAPGYYSIKISGNCSGLYNHNTLMKVDLHYLNTPIENSEVETRIGGGQRIKSIFTSDGDSDQTNDMTIRIEYTDFVNSELSSGKLISKPLYKSTHRDQVQRNTGLGYLTPGGGVNITLNSENDFDCQFNFVNSSSVVPLQTENGSFIVYSYVKVFNDVNGQLSGFTDYFYKLDDIPDNTGLISGINFSRSWRNSALRRSNTYNSDGELLATVIYEYEPTQEETIYGVQSGVVGESGIQLAIATGVDHDALRKIQRTAVKDMFWAALNFASSWGRGLGMTTASINFAMSAFSWIQARIIANNNPQNSYQSIGGTTIPEYQTSIYSNRTEAFELKKVSFKEYDPNDNDEFLAVSSNYEEYHHYALPKISRQHNVNVPAPYGYVKTIVKYSDEYELHENALVSTDPMVKALAHMKLRNMKSIPIETIYVIGTEEGIPQVVGGHIKLYKLVGDLIVPTSEYNLELNDFPYSLQQFTNSYITNSNAFYFDKEPYRKVVDYSRHDQFGQPLHIKPVNNNPISVICEYPSGKPIASVYNANPEDCAYTSFEKHGQGGFEFEEASVIQQTTNWLGFNLPIAKTGQRCYTFQGETISRYIQQGKYLLSFWVKNGQVDITYSSPIQIESVLSESQDERGWRYKQYEITYDGTIGCNLTISSNSPLCYIDELRLHPLNSIMSTTCYNFDGSVNTTCDENNFCSYTGYDAASRPIWTMDNNYNVRASLVQVIPASNSTLKPKFVSRIMLNEGTLKSNALNENLNSWDMITTQFFYDGLGRITQTQGLKQSPNGKDIIAQNFYDKYGRTIKTYMPFVRNFEGQDWVNNFIEEQQNFYSNQPDIKHTEYASSEVVYDNSPRNRIIEVGAVGEDWQLGSGHTLKQEFLFNEPNEVLFFRVQTNIAETNYAGSYSLNRKVTAQDENNLFKYWPEDKLKKIITTDENGKSVLQYYDPFGRLILKRMLLYGYESNGIIRSADFTSGMATSTGEPSNGEIHFVDTYFVYDNFGKLRFEIPPSLLDALIESGQLTFGEGSNMINYNLYYNLGYGYKYDIRGNLFIKHSPGIDDYYIVYDEQNRIVMTQDAKQRIENNWSFNRYDELGRLVYQGILNSTIPRSELQKIYYREAEFFGNAGQNNDFSFGERRLNDGSGMLGYSHNNAPVNLNDFEESNILKVYYYDDYEFDIASLEYSGSDELPNRIIGLPTGQRTQIIGSGGQFLVSVTYYDKKLRPVEICNSNHLDGYDKYRNEYDWKGVLKKTIREHLPDPNSSVLFIEEEFVRDRMGRLLNHYQKTGHDRKVMLAGYEYNELGQIRRKHIHIPHDMNTGMQTIDYSYNERGWLRKINNAGLVDDGVNLEDYDVFGLQLNYTESDWSEEVNRYAGSPLVPQPMYNGNLASIIWNSKAPNTNGIKAPEQTYVYRYDDMYRLTCGAYAKEAAGITNYGMFIKDINYYLEKTDYFANGNISRILRTHGPAEGMQNPFIMDHLGFDYAQNCYRLRAVKEYGYGNGSLEFAHFRAHSSDITPYEYDELGNCIKDSNKKLYTEYNELGLVSTFTHFDHTELSAIFTYDADGTLLTKKVGSETVQYIAGSEYVLEDGILVLQQLHTAEGIVRPKHETENNNSEFIYDYFLTDHLGNVRVIISEGNSEDEIQVATMELNNLVAEESEFQYLPYSRDAISLGYPANGETGDFVAALDIAVNNGPAHLSEVSTGDLIAVSVQSWFPDVGQNAYQNISIPQLVSRLALNLASQAVGILDEGLITLTTDEAWQILIGIPIARNQPEPFDPTYPQGYLVYMYFDASLTPDPAYSGMLQVTSPDELEELQTQLLSMPGEGFFYTYLTNFSDNLVTFDNLTIRHKQGTLRNIHEYYPYGLEYWHTNNKLYDRGDQYSEFHHREWEMDGIEMNRFAARWYDPQSPDGMHQTHSNKCTRLMWRYVMTQQIMSILMAGRGYI